MNVETTKKHVSFILPEVLTGSDEIMHKRHDHHKILSKMNIAVSVLNNPVVELESSLSDLLLNLESEIASHVVDLSLKGLTL